MINSEIMKHYVSQKNEKFFDESLKGTDIGQHKLIRVLNWAN